MAGNTLGFKQSKRQVDEKSLDWVLVYPENKIYNIKNLKKFSREMGIHSSSFSRVARKEASNYKGWLVYFQNDFSEEKMKKDRAILNVPKYKITSPSGEEFLIRNVKEICKKKWVTLSLFI